MTKTKFDYRLENAMNAFFETEPDKNRFELAHSGQASAIASTEPTFSEKAHKWTRIAREVLMLGPGTFALFYMTLITAFFYPAMGISFQGLFMFLSAAFLTYAGSGSLKSGKNLAVPLSIVTTALAIVPLSLLIFGRQDVGLYFWYSIYLFPFVLVLAKSIQTWLLDKE